MTTSTALVATERPARYAKQLTSHMSRKIDATWDDAAGSGSLTFPRIDEGDRRGPGARVHLEAREDGLLLDLDAEEDAVARYEQIVGIHLARFGAKDGLVVSWAHEDGTPGSSQGPVDPDELRDRSRPAPMDPSMEHQ